MKIFDSHFHIIDKKFELIPNNGYLPNEFTTTNYLNTIQKYNFCGGVIVSGSFQAFDTNYIINALNNLGDSYVGVINLKHDTPDEIIVNLNKKRIKAVRFNLYRGGSESIKFLEVFAHRIFDLCGMHIELYIDNINIKKHYNLLKSLPKISIDHLGLTFQDHEYLLKLIENGANVKATGFMRVDFDVAKMLKDIHTINPSALMFGSDLPGTRASRTFNKSDIDLIKNNFSISDQKKIFRDNAIKFYNL